MTKSLKDISWHSLDINEVFQKTGSSKSGLEESESKKRLQEEGLNLLQIKISETIPYIFFKQLRNPMIYVLLFSTALAFALKKFTDGFVVFSVVIVNTLIGFIQEYRAHRIIRALSAIAPHETIILRRGCQKRLLASHLVLGDVVFLQAGDKVPADLRLFSIKNLQCDESPLTGESLSVFKHLEISSSEAPLAERKCIAFSGTYVTAGTALGVVVNTGLKTEFGKISKLIENIVPLATPLSLSLKKIARGITFGVLFVSLGLFIVGFLRGSNLFDSSLAAVTLTVAAIPEGLPAIITIASAIGMRRMARRQAIVRQLPAVEALGSTTVICTDKTGTLTCNEMTVQQLWTPSGSSFVTGVGFSLEGQMILLGKDNIKDGVSNEIHSLLKSAILCSDAALDVTSGALKWVGDPTEIALVVAGRKIQLEEEILRSTWLRGDAIPFEPSRRFMATLHKSLTGEQFVFMKGAPEEMMSICTMDLQKNKQILHEINAMAKEGMRVLAVAEKQVPPSLEFLEDKELQGGFVFLGLIGMLDPLRNEVYRAVNACHEAGIVVKMVTGDHPITAKAIGKNLGLLKENDEVITGILLDQLDSEGWKKIACAHHVFARVSPEHKLKLVEALQACGHVVAMTGDGVNDAPALKRADIGISMGIKGTAVAKEASDMILADDNFASIEAAIEEGRRVYDNLLKALVFILPTSLALALVIFIAVLFFPLHEGSLLHPMLPVQILWVNLVVAVALSLPLAFEMQEPGIMKRIPRKKQAPIFSKFVLMRTFSISILMAMGAIGLFLWKYYFQISVGEDEKTIVSEGQTLAVTAMVLFQTVYLFHCRSLELPFFKISFSSNPSILLGTLVVLMAQIIFVYMPFMNRLFSTSALNGTAWLISMGVTGMLFLLIALEKYILAPAQWYRRKSTNP
jgi:magnesium-transporting ATPase (P-type)